SASRQLPYKWELFSFYHRQWLRAYAGNGCGRMPEMAVATASIIGTSKEPEAAMRHPLLNLREGPVARLRMNRPQVHNACDAELIAALTGALEAVGCDPDIRVVVLEGEGASFSAGADLNWMRGMAAASEDENRIDSLALARLMRALNELPKPTIANVHGAAFGGGVGLVACCDIAIGSQDAKFGLTESRLGLLPAVISPYVIEAIGARQARRWFASAEIFDAEQACAMGLLHNVVHPTSLDTAVQRQVDLLLKAGPVAS